MSDESKWTPEPWERENSCEVRGVRKNYTTGKEEHGMVARTAHGDWRDDYAPEYMECRANAERIVACVNACAGLADPSVVPELVAALRGLNEALGTGSTSPDCADPRCQSADCPKVRAIRTARALLARVDGGAS